MLPTPKCAAARTGLLLLVTACWTAPPAEAQSGRSVPPVYRDRVEPHWLADGTRFWYRNDLPRGRREFILVDAARGSREPAFDHARTAEMLSETLGRTVESDRLPVDRLKFEAEGVLLVGRERAWRLDPDAKRLHAIDAADLPSESLPASRAVRPSTRTGEETQITFLNRTAGPVEIFWLDTQAERRRYASLPPGAEHAQHTFSGHIWLVTDSAGRTLGVFEAEDDRSTAIIDGREPTTRPAREGRRRGRERAARGTSPDGAWTAFIKNHNVWIRPAGGGEDFALSEDGRAGDEYSERELWWSPDSRKLAALRTEGAQEHKVHLIESSPPDQIQPKLRTLDYLKPGDRVAHPRPRLFDLASRRSIPLDDALFQTPWSIQDLRWAADSSRFTFVYNQRGHQVLRVVAVDAADGTARALIDDQSETFICYSGKYYCHWLGEDEILWMSERDGWNHLWLYDAKSGRVKNQVTRGPWVVQGVERVDEAKRRVWFRAGGIRPGQDPYYTHFGRVNLDGGQTVLLTEGDGDHRVQWSPDRRWLIDTWSRVDSPPVVELRSGETGQLICRLETADAEDLFASRGGRRPARFVAKGRDGTTDIYGIVIFPRDFDSTRKYPVVENIYAGPQGFFTPKSFRASYGHQQDIADRGCIVVQCDGMGTSGRSKAFHDVCWQNLRDAGFPDRIAWIKAASREFPQMDLGRVGIYGGSAGGQNAMAALLWHHDFYQVAVADCGCHDNRMDKIWWNEQWMGWPVGTAYAANSNVANAHRLKGKLMLIVGELDNNVDPASTMQVVNALEKADKDFDLVIVTGTGHGAAETPYGSRRRADFLARHLIGGSPN